MVKSCENKGHRVIIVWIVLLLSNDDRDCDLP